MKDEIISLKDYCTLYILQKSKIKHLEKALYPFSLNTFFAQSVGTSVTFQDWNIVHMEYDRASSVRTSLHLNLEH